MVTTAGLARENISAMTCSRGVRGPAGAIVGAKSSAVAGAAIAGAGEALVRRKGKGIDARRPAQCLRVIAAAFCSLLAWAWTLHDVFSLSGSVDLGFDDRASIFQRVR
jgi:hypothetical protein